MRSVRRNWPRTRRALARAAGVGVSVVGVRSMHAQVPGRPGLTLTAAVDAALRQSFEVRIARAAIDSARAERRIAGALPNPSYAGIPNAPYQYSASVPIDIGPQRVYRTRASALGADAARDDARDVSRQLTFAVQRAYYDALLADARTRLAADRRDVVGQIAASDSARVRAGDIAERNLVRDEVELVRADAERVRAAVDAQTARLTLQGLMGSDRPDTALVLADTLSYRPVRVDALAALLPAAMRARPDVAAASTRVTQGATNRRLAAASLVPIPQLTYVRQFSGGFDNGHAYAFGVGFEIPLLNQYGGQRERATASAAAAGYASERLTAQVARDVTSALATVQAQRALVERYEAGLIAKVAQNVAALRYAYTRGAVSLLEVLDALRAQQDVLTDYSVAIHDYWIGVFALRAAVGDSGLTPAADSARGGP